MRKWRVGQISGPMQCDHCKNKTLFEVVGIYDYKWEDELASDYWVFYSWELLKCMTCYHPTLMQVRCDELQYLSNSEIKNNLECILEDKGQFEKLYPTVPEAPEASSDMPKDIVDDYNEARAVLPYSPRASAALLRLALQKLCKHLGQPGKNINDDIKALVKGGLSPQVQQALDSVRVIGNNAVHPGELDLNDNSELAVALFDLINFIIQEMITRPRMITKIYDKLPQDKLDQIKKRDGNL